MSAETSYDVIFEDRYQDHSIPLQTPNNIDGSETLIHQSTGSRLVMIQQRFIVKFGIHVHPIEAQNMIYVAKSTSIPVPKVYAIYQRRGTKRIITYIVMEYVPGTTLLDLWGSLDETRKTAIAKSLRATFDQLRQLQPPSYFGDINGGPPLDDLFSETLGAEDTKTSLATEDELIDSVIRIYSR